tara:strand:- start:161 stop:421 length:261 start_codon:yes stop_codon:yes gene_type:complete
MELPEDVKNFKDLNKNIKYIVEDMWARIFGLSLGVPCPNERAKELYINFVTKKYKEDTKDFDYVYLDEKYCYEMITDFINYLVDRG